MVELRAVTDDLVVEQQTALLQELAQTYYRDNGTVDGFFDYYRENSRPEAAPPQQPGSANQQPPDSRDLRGLHGLVDTDYRALIPTFGYKVGDKVPSDLIQNPIAVEVDGKVIAWILPGTKIHL